MNKFSYDFDKFFKLYDVTEDGRVFEKATKKELKQYLNSGYLEIQVNKKGFFFRCKVHRLVARKYLQIPEEFKKLDLTKVHINHIDGNKKNNHYSNLEWCSAYYNNLHARHTGLNPVAKSNSMRWLNKDFAEKTSNHMREVILKAYAIGARKPKNKYRLISPLTGKSLFLLDACKELGISYSKGYRHLRLYLENKENLFISSGYVLEGQSTIEKSFSKETTE